MVDDRADERARRLLLREAEPRLEEAEAKLSRSPGGGIAVVIDRPWALAHPALVPPLRRQIASRGGKAAHEAGGAHAFTSDEARLAGRKGGERVSQDREHMAAIGQRGGERVSQDREHMARIGKKGGQAVSGNREHMAQIGKKGGEARSAERAAG